MKTFNTNIPIYMQIIEDIKVKIANGTLKPGDKIESVREMAERLKVNPNTIQRALTELERQGFIRTERAIGKYVSDNETLFLQYRQLLIQENMQRFVEQMQDLGIRADEMTSYLENYLKEIKMFEQEE